MAKGNRNSKEVKPIDYTALTKAYSEQLQGYRAFAEARRKARKYDQTSVTGLYQALCGYVEECNAKQIPLTVAGVMLALNVNKDLWCKAKNGDLDLLLEEYIDLNHITPDDIEYIDGLPWHINPDGEMILLISFSELRQKADLMIQEQLERNCYTNKGNPAGSIFGLKAQFQWREDDTPQHLVQQLVIADLEQAKKALDMLK